jgi:KDO2-lipid IV(A) lauroyltransferase
VSQIAFQEFRQTEPAPPPRTLGSRFRTLCAEFWLNYFFWFAERLPRYCVWSKWFHLWFALRHSRVINANTRLNARRIFGPEAATPERCARFTRDVVSNFFDFVYDVGRTRRMSRQQLMTLVESIHGHERYTRVRSLGKGAIVVTAHMGSFEAGLAALLEHEPKPIHVVFKRDERGRFEQIRRSLRERLGVREAAIDEGWTIWMRLRDALAADEVVNLQGDRVMPGQKGQAVRFLHGHLLLPTGPIKLAIASGAPLVPVFSIRTPDGRIRIHIEEPIWVDPAAAQVEGVHPALLEFAAILERYVKAYPEQWLLLQPAFVEDTDVRREVRA